MRLLPISSGSVLTARQYHLYLSLPRTLRLNFAHSLLAERLSVRRQTQIYCRCQNSRRNERPVETDVPDTPKPVDRVWPSDLPVEERIRRVEEALIGRIQLRVGSILDVWS